MSTVTVTQKEADSIRVFLRAVGISAQAQFGERTAEIIPSMPHAEFLHEVAGGLQSSMIEFIRQYHPNDGILASVGEFEHSGSSGRLWVITAIEGAANFLRGSDHWSTSVAAYDLANNMPVFGAVNFPALGQLIMGGSGMKPLLNNAPIDNLRSPGFDQCFVAKANTSLDNPSEEVRALLGFVDWRSWHCVSYGSATYSLLEVVLGRLDGYHSEGEHSWDVLAMLAIVRELGGGHLFDWLKDGLKEPFVFTCGNERFMDEVRNGDWVEETDQ